jgi:drug/metabolite transporter (DMT)-like permease
MLGILLAVASAVGYGAADFAGGLASRRIHVLRVVSAAAPAGLMATVLLLPIGGATWSTDAIIWGGLSGVASACAYGLLYRTLAIGPMSLLSPISAVVSAIIPVAVGVAEGERLGIGGVVGLAASLVAIALLGGPNPSHDRPRPSTFLLAVASGAAIAGQLVFLHQAPQGSGLAPLAAGAVVSSACLVGAAVVRRNHLGSPGPGMRIGALSGVLSAGANLAFLLAVRSTDLAIVALITAMYPAITLLLARLMLGERVHRLQAVGLAVAALALAALTIA